MTFEEHFRRFISKRPGDYPIVFDPDKIYHRELKFLCEMLGLVSSGDRDTMIQRMKREGYRGGELFIFDLDVIIDVKQIPLYNLRAISSVAGESPWGTRKELEDRVSSYINWHKEPKQYRIYHHRKRWFSMAEYIFKVYLMQYLNGMSRTNGKANFGFHSECKTSEKYFKDYGYVFDEKLETFIHLEDKETIFGEPVS